jgi:hypothetical protein
MGQPLCYACHSPGLYCCANQHPVGRYGATAMLHRTALTHSSKMMLDRKGGQVDSSTPRADRIGIREES